MTKSTLSALAAFAALGAFASPEMYQVRSYEGADPPPEPILPKGWVVVNGQMRPAKPHSRGPLTDKEAVARDKQRRASIAGKKGKSKKKGRAGK